MPNAGNQTPHVQSVDRALQLLEILAAEGNELSLTEISRRAGWPKTTVYGLISTLRDRHYIEQSPVNGRYRLGVRLFELGNLVARSWDIRRVALPIMQRLNQQLGEMIQLAAEDRGEVLYLEKLDSTQMMRIVSEIGVRLPMHCSGLGKVLLAYKTPAEVKWILNKKGMPRFTSRTITEPAQLDKELVQVRQQGYAMDNREIMDSLRCVAAPIWDRDGKVKYAISVSGLANNMQGSHLEKALAAVVSAAADISFSMGYREEEVSV